MKENTMHPEPSNVFRQLDQINDTLLSFITLSCTSASVKSYQLVKVVSGGRAPGKSSSLASPELLVIERFHCFGAVRMKKFNFCIALIF